MPIKLEIGKFYLNRLGQKIGPIESDPDKFTHRFKFNDINYDENGRVYIRGSSAYDLVEELAD